MGKYTHLLPNLPKLEEEPRYQQAVDMVKEQLVLTLQNPTREPAPFARYYHDLKVAKERFETELAKVQVHLTACEQLMAASFEASKITSLKLDNGATVTGQPEPYAGVDNKEDFRQWCLANGLERSLTLPWMTTNSLMKEALINGEALPKGLKAFVKYDKFVLRGKDPKTAQPVDLSGSPTEPKKAEEVKTDVDLTR